METPKRIIEIDIARALAILAVIVIHISATPLIENFGQDRGPVSLLYLVLNVAARFGVPTFVMLSGMGLALSYRPGGSYVGFLKRRLGKIVPAYLAWSLIYSLFYNGDNGALAMPHGVSVSKIAADMVTGGACYHLYFVPLIVILYLLFPVLWKILRTNAGLAGASAVTIVTICISRYASYPGWMDYILDIRSHSTGCSTSP